MRFNSKFAMGFLVGYFIMSSGVSAIVRADNYAIFEASLGIAIAIIFGIAGGKR